MWNMSIDISPVVLKSELRSQTFFTISNDILTGTLSDLGAEKDKARVYALAEEIDLTLED
jgi:hypothetical protein